MKRKVEIVQNGGLYDIVDFDSQIDVEFGFTSVEAAENYAAEQDWEVLLLEEDADAFDDTIGLDDIFDDILDLVDDLFPVGI